MIRWIFPVWLWLLLVFMPVGAEPPASLTVAEAAAAARQTLAMQSLEQQKYKVYVISDDEKYIGSHYYWAGKEPEKNWQGHYYLYLQAAGSDNVVKQNFYQYMFVINPAEPDKNGFYVVPGKAGLPDILVHTERLGIDGAYDTTAFLIKDGSLQQLRYINKNGRLMYSHHAGRPRLYYLDDGTFAVPDLYRDHLGVDTFTKVYMLDIQNLLFTYAYETR